MSFQGQAGSSAAPWRNKGLRELDAWRTLSPALIWAPSQGKESKPTSSGGKWQERRAGGESRAPLRKAGRHRGALTQQHLQQKGIFCFSRNTQRPSQPCRTSLPGSGKQPDHTPPLIIPARALNQAHQQLAFWLFGLSRLKLVVGGRMSGARSRQDRHGGGKMQAVRKYPRAGSFLNTFSVQF